MHIYSSCGLWNSSVRKGWSFLADKAKGGRLLNLDGSSTIEKLKLMVSDDFGIDLTLVNLELSYLPSELINTLESPPVIISNDRQVKKILTNVRTKPSTRLCVCLQSKDENLNREARGNLNNQASGAAIMEGHTNENSDVNSGETNFDEQDIERDESDDEKMSDIKGSKGDNVRFALLDIVKKGQHFSSKMLLKATFEICAMKHNFDYKVVRSDTKIWYIRCADEDCSWRVRAEGLKGSSYFIIRKYVAEHSFAPSARNKSVRTASAKTIGNLIMHKYDGVKAGPKCNDIIELMRDEHGIKVSKSLAWDCVRGFYRAIRKVIVLDGTFLKSKFKGVLLVATALDGNSNLYPLAFGVVDSENDLSWNWFMRQLKVVIADEQSLAFFSNRNTSLGKAIANVHPQSHHGICIHHLLNNVVTYYHGKGLVGLVAKASKAYRVADFQKIFTDFCSISPTIGKYLIEADVRKWARCQFHGFGFDIRTNNHVELMNSALCSPREFPIIPLLDSIREMMTRWFFERRTLSSKNSKPLTTSVEKKIDRRIQKGKTFTVYPINDYRFLVRGDKIECMVDLVRRTCSCGKFDLLKIPCRHAIKAGFSVGKQVHSLTDEKYTTSSWISVYEESINPISVPEDAWIVP
ncbi:PREDICTED: uncharacterized protein LOC106297461 [Brassica oleracea var. oleracea]|uniref:uncharacterized protein LOC106297461 n=1 Tax=Brassica oleracea var. oleracea TaxID=109376 RepID=UPI0006A6C5E3|nr:PREDICTED: uncharacterized protein LOC106297461 [Brassica oleracea var. oleracea]